MWLHVEASIFLDCLLRIPRWLHVEASKEPRISKSKIVIIPYTLQSLLLKSWRTDTANQRGGSEWEPIKILLKGDGNSNKMNTASNTRLWLTTQVGQAHVATGVSLDLGTNTQPSDPRMQRDTKPRVYRPTPVRPVSTTGQTGPCLWNWATFTKWLHTGQTGETHRLDRSQPESPQSTKQANRPPN
jgi:hypothetical protein